MSWLPDTPDELFGAIVIVAVLGAFGLVLLGRLLLSVSGWAIWRCPPVNSSAQAGASYGEKGEGEHPKILVSREETEAEMEMESPAETIAPPVALGAMVYTPEQIERIKADAKLAGAAEAFGLLLGAGHLAAAVNGDQLTTAKRLVFGTSGRRMSAANKLIATAAASVSPPTEARLVPVNDGERGHVEL